MSHLSERLAAGRTNPWLVFLLPFVVYLLAGSFEPAPPGTTDSGWFNLGIAYSAYPLIYTLKTALTILAIALVWPGYRQFPWRIESLAFVVGVAGAVVWIALAVLQRRIASQFHLTFAIGSRSAFNPLAELHGQPVWAYAFLAVRFIGLAVVVPVIEEFFLRGFAMRFVMAADWWKVPFGMASRLAIVVGTMLPVLEHPQEALAAAVWFSAVTWLMLRTLNIWDCVAAHATTNLLLGVYVLASGSWWLM